jgi:hypothetical protein
MAVKADLASKTIRLVQYLDLHAFAAPVFRIDVA